MRYAMTLMAAVVLVVNLANAREDKKAPDVLPGDATWNLSELEQNCVIIKTSYDPDTREVVWVLECKRDIGRFSTCFFKFLDADGVRLATTYVNFNPEAGNSKGDHLKGTIKLPSEAIMKETKKIITTGKQ